MNVLIFGGSGFLGCQLASWFALKGENVTIADIKLPVQKKKNTTFVQFNITEEKALMGKEYPRIFTQLFDFAYSSKRFRIKSY